MCGLIALCDANGGLRAEDLTPALKILAARGPDDSGTFVDAKGRIALGHTRLAVVGLNNGHQPLHHQERDLWAVVNGEFYDHEPQRTNLEKSGARFRTDSDSELLLHLYEKHGLDAVHFLRGEFAFILWDSRHQRLVAGRDAFGVKPLLYHEQGSRLRFASNAKALFASGVTPRWDKAAVHQALLWQYPAPAETLFQDIKQLPPGCLLVHEHRKTRITRWFRPDAPPNRPPTADDGEHKERFAARLRESVALRLRGDVPVSCHLSGGLDSSSILALATELGATPPTCFTVSFGTESYDEIALAREVAARFDAPLNVLRWDPSSTMRNHLEHAVVATEGLAVNGHLPAKYLLNKLIQEAGFKVALSGEGADELLLGYPHLRVDLCHSANLNPGALGNNEASRGLMMPHGAMLDTTTAHQLLGFTPTWLAAKAGMGRRMQVLLREPYREDRGSLHRFLKTLPPTANAHQHHPVETAARLWTQSALPQYILKTLGDGCEAAWGIEGRPPFLDTELWKVARELPLDLKIRHRSGTKTQLEEKYILRDLMRDRLPPSIVQRRKHPFVAPPMIHFGRQDDWWQDRLRDSIFAKLPFFEPAAIKNLLDQNVYSEEGDTKSWDPVITPLLSLHALQKHLNPEAP